MLHKNYLFLFLFLLLATACKKHSVSYKTLTLQPIDNPNEVHIFGNNTGNEGSNPLSPEIDGAAWTQNSDTVGVRAALQFDLSSIPASAVIDSSRLTLYSNPTPLNGNLVDANYGTDNTLLIQQITAPWTASAVRWTNQPIAISTGEIIIPSTTQSFLDLPNIDVTSMVNNMVKNNTNYGFLIRLQTEIAYNSRIFCSSKYSDTTKHPKIAVWYHTSD
jgi:hypothetical protein